MRLTDFATIEVVWLPEEVTFSYAPDTGMTPRTTNIRAMDRFDGNKFNLQSYCYYDSIAECDGTGRAAFMIATADAVHADGAFRAIAELLESGKKAVCVTSFDILDKAAAEVLSVGDAGDEGARGEALIVRLRELVRLALDHLHPSAAEAMVDSDRFPAWKHNLNWRVGGEGLVQRWFSMHPLVVVPAQKSYVEVNEQIDGSYLFTVVPDLEHVHVVTDSDEICVSCLAPADYYYPPTTGRQPVLRRHACRGIAGAQGQAVSPLPHHRLFCPPRRQVPRRPAHVRLEPGRRAIAECRRGGSRTLWRPAAGRTVRRPLPHRGGSAAPRRSRSLTRLPGGIGKARRRLPAPGRVDLAHRL